MISILFQVITSYYSVKSSWEGGSCSHPSDLWQNGVEDLPYSWKPSFDTQRFVERGFDSRFMLPFCKHVVTLDSIPCIVMIRLISFGHYMILSPPCCHGHSHCKAHVELRREPNDWLTINLSSLLDEMWKLILQ